MSQGSGQEDQGRLWGVILVRVGVRIGDSVWVSGYGSLSRVAAPTLKPLSALYRGVAARSEKSFEVYDEEGYLSTPPCLWGEQEGLQNPPILFENTTMQMVTYFNTTWGHPGQMGIWQMKAAVVE